MEDKNINFQEYFQFRNLDKIAQHIEALKEVAECAKIYLMNEKDEIFYITPEMRYYIMKEN